MAAICGKVVAGRRCPNVDPRATLCHPVWSCIGRSSIARLQIPRASALQQFAPNTRRTPKHILDAHLPDQGPQGRIDASIRGRPPRLRDCQRQYRRIACAMPAQQCLRPNDLDRVQDRGKPAIELDENSHSWLVNSTRPRILRCRTITCCRSAAQQECDHRDQRSAILSPGSTRRGFEHAQVQQIGRVAWGLRHGGWSCCCHQYVRI